MFILYRYLLVGLVTVMVAGCAAGGKNFSEGQKLESQQRFEEAMYSYAEAAKADPETPAYRLRFLAAKERAATARSSKGDELYAAGKFAEAVAEYQTASGLDGGQGRYVQKAERAAQMRDAQAAFVEGSDLEKKNKLREAARAYATALELAPANKEYRQAAQRVAGLRKSKLDGFELQLKSNRPITLRFRDARLKDVFNVVTQLSGINFVFDDSVKDQNVTINLENATFYQAMDLLIGMNKLARKTLNETTVIIYPRSTEKVKQYEDMVIRTYNFSYLDAKKAVNLIRSIVQVRKLYVNEEANALILRDTAEVADVVEKILDAHDVPDAEVVLDVEVIELTDKNTYDVGLLLNPYSVSLAGANPDGTIFSPALLKKNVSDPVGVSQLLKAFNIKSFGGYVTVPNATYNFGKTLAKGDVLSNPKIRIKNREKAKFNVGTRIPITTTTSVNQTTSVNVQYVDVGVKVNAEPTIQVNNEVSIRLTLEVSQAGPKQKVGTDEVTQVVDINTRNLETVLSLKDGETSIIGGLIERQDSFSKSSPIGIGDIPLLGTLLSDNVSDKRKTELLLAITPRLVRGITVPNMKTASFNSGKEDDPTLVRPYASFELEPEYPGDKKQEPKAAGIQAAVPVHSTGAAATAVSAAATETAPKLAANTKATQAGKATMGFAGPSESPLGEPLVLPVQVAQAEKLTSSRFTVNFDPEIVEFVSVTEGAFFKEGGSTTTFSGQPGKPGTIAVTVSHPAGSAGISGDGTLAVLTFKAKKQGPAGFSFENVNLVTAGGAVQQTLALSSFVDIN